MSLTVGTAAGGRGRVDLGRRRPAPQRSPAAAVVTTDASDHLPVYADVAMPGSKVGVGDVPVQPRPRPAAS